MPKVCTGGCAYAFTSVFNACESTLVELEGGEEVWARDRSQMEATLVRGRWERFRTARIYFTEGMAALQGTKLTDWQVQLTAHFASILVDCGGGRTF